MLDYTILRSMTPDEFADATTSVADARAQGFTESDAEDLRKIERLLDVEEGALADQVFLVEPTQCVCGRVISMYDVVFTALVDALHSKSFILHTLIGNKLIANPPRDVRCSVSGHLHKVVSYTKRGYGCRA